MQDSVRIRPCRIGEIEGVLDLWRDAEVTPPSASDSIEGLRRLMAEPAAILLVAEADERIIGSVIGGWDGWRGNIYRLAVTPAYRRKGIARRLVAEVSAALFAKGAERISALVERAHPWAIGFWDSLKNDGYENDERFARYIADREPARTE
jgi:ribosomal protein S18 acetylase RimI-like enzyme